MKKFIVWAGALAFLAGLVGIAASGVLSGRHVVHSDPDSESNEPAAVARRVLTSVPLIDGLGGIDY